MKLIELEGYVENARFYSDDPHQDRPTRRGMVSLIESDEIFKGRRLGMLIGTLSAGECVELDKITRSDERRKVRLVLEVVEG